MRVKRLSGFGAVGCDSVAAHSNRSMGRKTKWMDESTGKRGRKAFVYKGLERLSVQRPEKRNGLHCFTSGLHQEDGKREF